MKSKETSTTSGLSLDNFEGIPMEIDGCSCYFSRSEDDFKNKIYLFSAGYDSIGFVSINNKLIKIKLDSSERKTNSFGEYNHKDFYSSGQYKVIVDINYKGANGEETSWYEGIITIKNSNGDSVSRKFVGECGC